MKLASVKSADICIFVCLTFILCVLLACSIREVMVPSNYDHLIGKSFSASIFKGRQVFKVVRETKIVEELENRRSDGCVIVFGVRKKDDIIEYWRIDSPPGTCQVTKNPHNV